MGTHRNKLTDRQREVMGQASKPDPEDRIIGAQWVRPARILAVRGYVTLQPLGNGWYRVDLTELARQNSSSYLGWRRYPPLRRRCPGLLEVPGQ
jgi:hypothetical protein